MKQFLQDKNGQLSSTRLLSFLVVFAVVIDWMNSVFTIGVWNPNINTIIFVLSVLGIKLGHKFAENGKKNS